MGRILIVWDCLSCPLTACTVLMLCQLSKVCEVYFILEPDCRKDSSTEVTILQRLLDETQRILEAKGTRMPGHLITEVAGLDSDCQ